MSGAKLCSRAVGFGSVAKVTGIHRWSNVGCIRHLPGVAASNGPESFVGKHKIIELDCYRVRRELVNWMEGDLTADLRAQVDLHLQNCQHCTAVYDGARNVVRLLNDKKALELPPRLSKRLYHRLFRAR